MDKMTEDVKVQLRNHHQLVTHCPVCCIFNTLQNSMSLFSLVILCTIYIPYPLIFMKKILLNQKGEQGNCISGTSEVSSDQGNKIGGGRNDAAICEGTYEGTLVVDVQHLSKTCDNVSVHTCLVVSF